MPKKPKTHIFPKHRNNLLPKLKNRTFIVIDKKKTKISLYNLSVTLKEKQRTNAVKKR